MKKISIKFIAIIAMVLILSSLVGCFSLVAKDKKFSISGMSITLTDEFFEKDYISLTAYYESRDAIVTVLKEDYASIGGISTWTVGEYADAVIAANNLSGAVVSFSDGYASFTYEKEVSGKNFIYFATCHKGGGAYWLVQFATLLESKEEFIPKFKNWASSIEFE